RARRQGGPQAGPATREARAWVGARPAAGPHWAARHHPARGPCAPRAVPRPPGGLADAVPPTAGQVAGPRPAAVEALAAVARDPQRPARPAARQTVRQSLPALAALVDCWWQGSRQDVEPWMLAPWWRPWGQACRVPRVSWDSQGARTRWRRRQATRRHAVAAVRPGCARPPSTPRRARHVLAAWQAWATDRSKSVPRTSAAVEGRHGALA